MGFVGLNIYIKSTVKYMQQVKKYKKGLQKKSHKKMLSNLPIIYSKTFLCRFLFFSQKPKKKNNLSFFKYFFDRQPCNVSAFKHN